MNTLNEIDHLKEQHLYRELKTLTDIRGVHAKYQAKDVTLFCSNDYLGLGEHPRVVARAREAAQKEGVGSGASRLISGHTEIHALLDQRIAKFKGKARAIVYSSGYMANVGAITALATKDDLIVFDKLCHASIIDGIKLSGAKFRSFQHKDYDRADDLLTKEQGYRKRFLISESLFSMDGDLADLDALARLKHKHDCVLMIDDAHGTGVLGPTGKGAFEGKDVVASVDLLMGTFSKAVGVQGGYVAGSAHEIDYLINRSRPFIFATSLSPVLCHAIEESLQVIEEEPALRQTLWQNTRFLYNSIQDLGFELRPLESPILPVIVGEEERALDFAKQLLEQGFFVPAIRTPTVAKGEARLRVTVSAQHSQEDLKRFVEAMKGVVGAGPCARPVHV